MSGGHGIGTMWGRGLVEHVRRRRTKSEKLTGFEMLTLTFGPTRWVGLGGGGVTEVLLDQRI